MNINFVKLNEKAKVPTYGTCMSAGVDIVACLKKSVVIEPGEFTMITSGIAIQIPEGYFGMVCSRSGLAGNHGICVLNSPGILDSDYRGEIKVILLNQSDKSFVVEHGMRIAQLVVLQYETITFSQKEALDETKRGEGGFGSTGNF